ncbi:potassium channel family protein [Acinetobacter baumannii]|nr:potassium channel family protein [Acinetobacter baumannii]EHU1211623.1 two pore domain potassium channel family protein [Acinetobacter nosocomialis]MDQ9824397.1 potassium channel family protein [Acinetobacter sp. 163]MCA4375532.1 potassium channel family protein [Acinetobacter baumannii]MDC3809335.1 potassium channel family protein [Acinetobacter baumannii]MDC3924975.1 potassium channel family protein [Acinetobacter baumannii]
MNKTFKALGSIHPLKIGMIYLLLIVISALLLYLCPEFKLTSTTVSDPNSLTSSLYFTFVTITTLGYGDILPNNELTRILVIFLSFGGVVLTGLFLNSLAHTISKITQVEDENKMRREKFDEDVRRFLDISILLTQNFDDFKFSATSLITPLSKYNPSIDTSPLMNFKFNINDLCDLFKLNGLRRFPLSKTKIEVFYNSFDILNSNLDQLLKLGYFNFNNETLKIVVKYLSYCKMVDTRENILRFARLEQSDTEWIRSMLLNAKEEVQITAISNAIDDYILLIEQIKRTVSLIVNIESLINSINQAKCSHD